MRTNHQRGFTLIETLFYIGGVLLLLGAMISFMISMYDWYNEVTIGPRVDRAGVTLASKLVYDLRTGVSANDAQSSYGTTNGSLSFQSWVASSTVTKYFALSNGRMTYQENGGASSYLSLSGMTVSRFYVIATSTPVSQGVRFDIDITYSTKSGSQTRTYSGFAIMRQSYH